MIQSIEIHNLRGIEQGRLDDLTPLTVLVGPNGSGKSTVLDALLIGTSPTPGLALKQAAERRTDIREKERWLIRQIGGNKAAWVEVTNEHEKERRTELLFQTNDNRIDGKTLAQAGSSVAQFGIHYGAEVSPIEGTPEVKLLDARAVQEPLHKLYTRMVEQGRRKEASDTLRSVLPDLNHLEILTEDNSPIVHLVFENYSVPAALAGDGVYALLRLRLELALRAGGLVLLEEPEVHQHPAAIRQTAQAIHAAVRRGVQVVMTTHSLDLIDALLAESQNETDLENLSVYSVRLKDGCLLTSRVAGSDVAFARAQIGDDLR